MRGVGKGLGRGLAVAVAATAVIGVTACTAGGSNAGSVESAAPGVSVDVGETPSQDAIALYTDRDEAVAQALENLPGHVEDALEATGVPGAAVAVVSEGEMVYAEGFGLRDNTTTDLVDENTVFQIASLSKPVSATILSKAMTEDDSITWNTPVSQLMPDFTMRDPYVTANATVGDYFSHRTGIPTGGGDDLEDVGFDREYILDHLNLIPLAPFRTTYQYSNFGLTTGAEAVAVARGQEWEDMADELLFEPLGMTSTSMRHADYLARDDRAVLHARVAEGEYEPLFDREPDSEAPAGGVSSNVVDLAKWLELVLADGELDGAPFIDPVPLTTAFSAHIVNSGPSTLDSRPGHYGYGTNVSSTVGGRVTLTHSGAFGSGGATIGAMVPDLDLGIVVLTNGAPSGVPESINSMFMDDVLYGEQTREWVDAWSGIFASFSNGAGDLVGQEAPADAALGGPASDYVGTFNSPYYGDLVVTEQNGVLTGAMGPEGGYTFELTPWEGDTLAFVPTGENALPGSLSSAVFTRDGDAITGVTMTYFNVFPAAGQQPNGLGVFTRVG